MFFSSSRLQHKIGTTSQKCAYNSSYIWTSSWIFSIVHSLSLHSKMISIEYKCIVRDEYEYFGTCESGSYWCFLEFPWNREHFIILPNTFRTNVSASTDRLFKIVFIINHNTIVVRLLIKIPSNLIDHQQNDEHAILKYFKRFQNWTSQRNT